jgi:putative endonuclease
MAHIVTNNLRASATRATCAGFLRRNRWEHKNDVNPGFARDYKVHRLVYYESFQYVNNAIVREKTIKGWLRRKKIALIGAGNPTWEDLSASWFNGKQILPLRLRSGSG